METELTDGLGVHRVASPEVTLSALRMLGVAIDRIDGADEALRRLEEKRWAQMMEPCVVAWDGNVPVIELRMPEWAGGAYECTLQIEGGDEWFLAGDLAELQVRGSHHVGSHQHLIRELHIGRPVPLGYHRLYLESGGVVHRSLIIAAPGHVSRTPSERPRRHGVFAPLYALRGSGVIGDLKDAARLGDWMKSHGGSVLGTLPLLAAFLDEPFEPSPYAPVSRMFWNELYLDVAALGGPDITAADNSGLLDYRAAMAAKRGPLEALAAEAWANEQRRAELEDYVRERPGVGDYAVFRAACETHRTIFRDWPTRQRDGILGPEDYDESARRYHIFVQREMNRQLARLGESVELYLDLPIGANTWGYDMYRYRDVFCRGASVGAPPDALFSAGQDWGLPPLHPERQRQDHYRYLRNCLKAHFEHASMLRIDHVMGLHRLYCIPEGVPATDGLYVHYNAEEVYAIVCLEEHRSGGADVVGEDLGTVPDAVRPAMERHGFHRLYVSQFDLPDHDDAHFGEAPAVSVASLNTHDMPTFAGFWNGAEIEVREQMGLLDAEQVRAEREARERVLDATSRKLGVERAVEPVMHALIDRLAASEARVALLTLEDLWLEPAPQNVPGTGAERPNWRRRMSRTVDEIVADDSLGAVLDRVSERRD